MTGNPRGDALVKRFFFCNLKTYCITRITENRCVIYVYLNYNTSMRKPLKIKRILRSRGSLRLPRIRSEHAVGPVDPHSLWYVYLQALVGTVPWCVSLILITNEILMGAGQNNYLFKLWLMCSSNCTHRFVYFFFNFRLSSLFMHQTSCCCNTSYFQVDQKQTILGCFLFFICSYFQRILK